MTETGVPDCAQWWRADDDVLHACGLPCGHREADCRCTCGRTYGKTGEER